MDSDLYDEFGNYIGPDLESDDDDDQSIYGQDIPDDIDVSTPNTHFEWSVNFLFYRNESIYNNIL